MKNIYRIFKSVVILCLICIHAFSQTPLSGTYTIGGVNPAFTTLKEAVDSLVSKGVSGPVIFNIRPGVYNERVLLPEISGTSAINKVTFRSSTGKADDVTIIHSGGNVITDHHVIMLKGADHIIIEKLSIKNTADKWGSGIHLTMRSDSNIIRYCKITVDSLFNETYAEKRTPDGRPVQVKFAGIIAAGIFDPLVGTQSGGINVGGWSASHTIVRGNEVRGQYGILMLGKDTQRDKYNTIDSNKIWVSNLGINTWMNDAAFVTDNIINNVASPSLNGIFMAHGEAVTFKNNKAVNSLGTQYSYLINMYELNFSNNSFDAFHIADANGNIKTSQIDGYVVNSSRVENNSIKGQYIVGFSGFNRPGFIFRNNYVQGSVQFRKGANQLVLTGNVIEADFRPVTSSADAGILLWVWGKETFVANNMILSSHTVANGSRFPVVRFQGENSYFVHNTVVSYNTDFIQKTATDTNWWYSWAFGVDEPGNEKVLNNIFVNRNGRRAFYIGKKPGNDFEFDYNLFYTISPFAGTYDQRDVTLNDMIRLYGKGKNSFRGNPDFLSPTDLHVLDALVDGRGVPLGNVPIDIDGNPRDPVHPDVGADEFTLPAVLDVAVHSLEPLKSPTGAVSLKVKLSNNGILSLKDSVVRLAYSVDSGATWTSSEPLTLTGLIAQYDLQSYVFNSVWNVSDANKYDVCVRIETPGLKGDADKSNDTLCGDLCITIPPGVYTIDNSGAPADFANITEAVAWLTLSPLCGLEGPVIFDIRPGEYKERVIIPYIAGTSEVNTVTFRSATGKADDVIISNLTNLIGISLQPDIVNIHSGASYINFRDLTFSYRGLAGGTCVVCFGGAYSTYGSFHLKESDHITISGCTFRQADTLTGIINAPVTISGMGSGSRIENNIFYGGRDILLYDGDSIFVRNNRLYNTSGIKIDRAQNPVVEDNKIRQVNASVKGYDGALVTPETAIFLTDVIGGLIHRNDITKTVCGLKAAGCTNVTISNNTMYGFTPSVAPGNNGGRAYMPAFELIASNRMRLLHNAVRYDLPADQLNALVIMNTGTTAEVYNNIFSSSETDLIHIEDPGCLIGSDRNDWHRTISNAATRFGLVGTFAIPDLAAWQVTVNKDKNSMDTDPGFVDEAGDLHTSNPQLDKGGLYSPLVREDMDKAGRSNREPDIGADEFVIDNIDVAVSAIAPAVGILGSNTVTVTLSNEGLSPLTGKDIWLSFSGDNSTWSAPQKFISAGLATTYSTESFTFSDPYIISKTLGNRIYVKISTPLTGDIYAKNDTLSAPVCVSLDGTYAVGTAAPYFPDLASVEELLDKLACGIRGPITFELEPGVYYEDIRIPYVDGISGVNSITFRSKTGKASDVQIKGTEQPYTIQVFQTGHVRIENLTIENLRQDVAAPVHLADSVNDILIKGCVIITDTSLNYTPNLYVNGILLARELDPGASAVNSNNIRIIDNKILGGHSGIKLLGFTEGPNSGVSIVNNTIRYVYRNGIYAEYTNIDTVAGNNVYMDVRGDYDYGLFLFQATSSFKVMNNLFYRCGLYLDNCRPAFPATVSNNMIGGKLQGSLRAEGIRISQSANINVWYNSVHMESESPLITAAFYARNAENLDVRNNIFYNALATDESYAMEVNTASALTISDYNDLYSKGKYVARWAGSKKESLADLQAANGKEEHSISVNPQFKSAGDLHTLSANLDSKAVSLAGITDDFDGQLRDGAAPDIGADEYTLGLDAALSEILNPAAGQSVTAGDVIEVKVKITNAGNAVLDEIPVSYSINGQIQVKDTLYISSNPLSPGESMEYTFSRNWTPVAKGTVTLCAVTNLNGDIEALNDQACRSVSVLENTGIDAAVTAILKPAAGQALYAGDVVTVEITVANVGTVTLNNLPLSYHIDGDLKGSGTLNGSISPGQSKKYTFSSTWNPSGAGSYNLCASVLASNDKDPLNNEHCQLLDVQSAVQVDGGVSLIMSPLDGETVETGQERTVRVRIRNYGNSILSNIKMNCKVNGAIAFTETTDGGLTIPVGATKDYTFKTKWVASPADTGQLEFCVETALSADINIGNDRTCINLEGITTGISDEVTDTQFLIYPNPATSHIYLRLTEKLSPQNLYISLYSNLGSKILDIQTQNYDEHTGIAVDHLARGLYILEIRTKTRMIGRKKVIIQ